MLWSEEAAVLFCPTEAPVWCSPDNWAGTIVFAGASTGTLSALGRAFLVILQPKSSDWHFPANTISLWTVWCRDQHELTAAIPTISNTQQHGRVDAGDLWDLKFLQLSSAAGEDQRCCSYTTVKEKNERTFGTNWSKKHSQSLPAATAVNAGEHLSRGREMLLSLWGGCKSRRWVTLLAQWCALTRSPSWQWTVLSHRVVLSQWAIGGFCWEGGIKLHRKFASLRFLSIVGNTQITSLKSPLSLANQQCLFQAIL